MSPQCNVGAINTGQACVPVMKVQRKLIAVPTYDNTGALNEIDLTAGPFNAAYFTALINQTDPSKRWYPLPEMKNITDDRQDPLFQTFDDGSKVFINQGVRSFMGLIVAGDAAPQMLNKLDGLRGIGISFYAIDKEGNLLGKIGSSSTKFAPIEAETDTIYSILVKTKDKEIQQIKFGFDVAISEQDTNIRMIQSTELATSIANLTGLYDVTSVITSITTTGFVAKLKTDAGTPITPVLVKGLVIADFVSSVTATASKLRNATDAADVTITSVTEAPAGVYTFAFAAQTSGDVLILKPKKNGFDFTAVEAATITIP